MSSPAPTCGLRTTNLAQEKLVDALTTRANLTRSGEDTSLESSEGVGQLSHAVSTDIALASQARSLSAQLLCLGHRRLLDGAHVVLDLRHIARVGGEQPCHVLNHRLEVVADEVDVVSLVPGWWLRLTAAVGGGVVDVLRRHAQVVNDADAACDVDLVLLSDVLVLLDTLGVHSEAAIDLFELLCDEVDVGSKSLQLAAVVREEGLDLLAELFLLRDQLVDLLDVLFRLIGQVVEAGSAPDV